MTGKASRSLHLPPRILKVCVEALIGFSCIYSPDRLNNPLRSQGCILEAAPSVGTVGEMYIPMREERLRSL